MNSGIPTASGYEERITFKEIEEAGGPDRQANEKGLLANVPEGHMINGWDVNVCTVRQTSVKRTVRYHIHPVCGLDVCGMFFTDGFLGIHNTIETERTAGRGRWEEVWSVWEAPP